MFRFVDHTAELELELEAATPEEILAEAARAFADLATGGEGEAAVREVDVEAADLSSLLPRFLDELVFLADAEGFVPELAEVRLDGTRARAVLRGRVGAVRPLVKAATLHRAAFAPSDGGWSARVVLDV